MARQLDYQYDAITTDSNGNRIIDNAGTLGASNDITMDTGQFIDFDGSTQLVDTGIVPSGSIKTIAAKMSWDTLSGDGHWDGLGSRHASDRRLYLANTSSSFGTNPNGLIVGYGSAFQATSFFPSTGVIYDIVATLRGDGNMYVYVDDTFISSFAASWSGTSTININLGAHDFNGTLYYHDGLEQSVILSTAEWSAADVTHHYDNPEAIINMALGNEDASFSFTSSAVLKCWAQCAGTGSNVNELVGSGTAAITNFASSMWTNADLLTEGAQNALMKQTSGVPTALADAETVRFD